MKRCPSCGLKYPFNSDGFCAQCGRPLVTISFFERHQAILITAIIVGSFIVLIAIGRSLENKRPNRRSVDEMTQAGSPSSATATPTPTSHDRLVWAKNSISSKDFAAAEKQISLIPASALEYKEAQNLRAVVKQGIAAQRRAMAPKLREQLVNEYRQLVADANPHLNFIDSKITKTKGGYALWATHDFFSQYSLSSGDDAKVIQEWIYRNQLRLEDAEVVRVGLMGRGPYSSWVYFNVK